MNTKEIFIDMDEELFKNRDYDPRVLGWIKYSVDFDKETNRGYFDIGQIRKTLVPHVITYRKFNKAITALEGFGIVGHEGKEYYLLSKSKRNWFVSIDSNFLYFLDESGLDLFECKVLLQLISMDRFYRNKGGFSFSKKKLLDLMGYSYIQKNVDKMEQVLIKLATMELINYSAPYYLPGGKGPFRKLLKVNEKQPLDIYSGEAAVYVLFDDVPIEVNIPLEDWEELMKYHQGRNFIQVYAYTLLEEDGKDIERDLGDINVAYCRKAIKDILGDRE